MKRVTAHMKIRVLINHGAKVWQRGEWVPLSQLIVPGKSTAKNFLDTARRSGLTCMCACGCGVWAAYSELQFDHQQARINGGATTISWLQPLLRVHHQAKTRVDLKIRDKVRRLAAKFGRGGICNTDTLGGSRECAPRSNRWPPKGSRPLGGRPWQTFKVIKGGVQ